jgi:hypothetical protein
MRIISIRGHSAVFVAENRADPYPDTWGEKYACNVVGGLLFYAVFDAEVWLVFVLLALSVFVVAVNIVIHIRWTWRIEFHAEYFFVFVQRENQSGDDSWAFISFNIR